MKWRELSKDFQWYFWDTVGEVSGRGYWNSIEGRRKRAMDYLKMLTMGGELG